MDLSEALVDLLLVRLGREEEKQRVLELLVSELHLTREEARSSVDRAPVVLMEAVPMGQARVIQNRLYPFVDLLPRMETVPDQPEETISDPSVETDTDDLEETPAPDSAPTDRDPGPPVEEERISITSASEEVLSIERCHVCGRTPTSGERLAPCRSCAELTCRDCFDRIAHVCQKCAAEGKVIDAPLGRQAGGQKLQSRHGSDTSEPVKTVKPKKGLPANLVYVLIGALILGILAAFYFVDPLGLFKVEPPALPVVADTVSTTVADTVSADTSSALTDTLTAEVNPAGDPEVISSLSGLPLPAGADTVSDPPPIQLETQVPSGMTVIDEAGAILVEDAARIAATVPIVIDRFAVIRLQDSTVVAALSILHPEEDTVRYAMLRAFGEWLGPSAIDELVFYYSESEYYPVRTVSFVSEDFEELSGCMGPVDFQNCAGTTSEEVWSILTGELQSWMARY